MLVNPLILGLSVWRLLNSLVVLLIVGVAIHDIHCVLVAIVLLLLAVVLAISISVRIH